MSKRMFFIKTADENTKDKLLDEGFQLLHKEGEFWVFLNDTGRQSFEEDKTTIQTDRLCF